MTDRETQETVANLAVQGARAVKQISLIVIILLLVPTIGRTQECDSSAASGYGGWKPASTAPHDGTVVELLETYGVAPWYGEFKWTRDLLSTDMSTGKLMPFKAEKPTWVQIDKPGFSVDENNCLFWRPYTRTGQYVDPTNGAQNTLAYQCAYLHHPYDPKTGYCVP